MVHITSSNREYTGISLEIGTVSRAKRLEINISKVCNDAIHKEISKREREEKKR